VWKNRDRIVAFDLDNTLVVTKSGETHARSGDDWKWRYEIVPRVLLGLLEEGYGVVILSNQKHATGKKEEMVKKRIDGVLAAAGNVDVLVLCATSDDEYRKPSVGMWQYLEKHISGKIQLMGSLFIGDAAGRVGDFADSDLMFAKNVGVGFETPEWLFTNPTNIQIDTQPRVNYTKQDWRNLSERIGGPEDGGVELLVLVGSPASGKSTLCERLLVELGYVRVCQDEFGSKEKCMKTAREWLEKGICVVVDATNPTKQVRKEWIELGREYNAHVRAIVMTTNAELSKKMNRYRKESGGRDVPGIAFGMYRKKFEDVNEDEGFEEVITTPALLSFDDDVEAQKFLGV